MSRYKKTDISKVRTFPIGERPSRVSHEMFAKSLPRGADFRDFLNSLPGILKAEDLRALITHIAEAKKRGKPVLVMMGAHVIKTGLSPVLIDLMESGIIQGLAMNGAGAIHDVEITYFGQTSEDVAAHLKTGQFGMVEETASLLNESLKQDIGFGEALGQRIVHDQPPYLSLSCLGQAYRLGIPVTVHVALGTDIVHQHPNADGALIGSASMHDFHVFCHLVSQIHDGGVVLLFGSSVILPEVFLKALTVARNIHQRVEGFVTANFDMNQHYRPTMNVVQRPAEKGKGYAFTGHHEIMIPLLAAGIKQTLAL
ncbi:hypothetical protein JW948_09095 [bacterium]|nr:hypothetical protein [bacterium]